MKILLAFVLLTAGGVVSAFTTPVTQPKSRLVVNMAYVPDGMTPQQWANLKKKEKQNKNKKNFAAIGPQSFKSRSLQSFQEDLERGKAGHLMPVFYAKDKVKRGEIKQEDIPYMQRLGSWDNSDVKGAKKRQWNRTDQKYEKGEGHFASMTDKTRKMDWTGKKPHRKPPQQRGPAAGKNQGQPQKKNFFGGLFP